MLSFCHLVICLLVNDTFIQNEVDVTNTHTQAAIGNVCEGGEGFGNGRRNEKT